MPRGRDVWIRLYHGDTIRISTPFSMHLCGCISVGHPIPINHPAHRCSCMHSGRRTMTGRHTMTPLRTPIHPQHPSGHLIPMEYPAYPAHRCSHTHTNPPAISIRIPHFHEVSCPSMFTLSYIIPVSSSSSPATPAVQAGNDYPQMPK